MDMCVNKDDSCPKTKPAQFTPGGLRMMGQYARNTERLSPHRIVNLFLEKVKHVSAASMRHAVITDTLLPPFSQQSGRGIVL